MSSRILWPFRFIRNLRIFGTVTLLLLVAYTSFVPLFWSFDSFFIRRIAGWKITQIEAAIFAVIAVSLFLRYRGRWLDAAERAAGNAPDEPQGHYQHA